MVTPRTFRAYAAVVLILALVPAAPAAEQIDQSNLPEWDGGWTHVNPTADSQAVMWQTFTPACTNLTAVEIDILTVNPGRGDDVLIVEIAAAGVILAAAERSVEDGFDGLLRFEFPEVVPLVPEQLYELTVRDTGKGQFGWKYGSNTYERGSRYVFAQQQLGSDWFFRTYAWVESPATKYSGGTGESNDPYQIATAADLIALGETPEDYDKHFILTADIDLDPNLPGGKVFDKAVIAPDTDAAKGGFQGSSFTGVLDGNGYKISHLTIAGTDYLGLFGRLVSAAKVLNLGLEAVEVRGRADFVGGLVGNSGGSISSSYSRGSVHGAHYVGGLVGANHGSITASYSSGTVSGSPYVGGLVGTNGYAYDAYNVPIPTYSSITASYSSASVSGSWCVGGLVGSNQWYGSITKSYSSGSVSGEWSVGGLVGSNNYYGSIAASFWDIETSGRFRSAGGVEVGLTTDEMMDPHMLGLNGFANHPNWVLDAGRDYPRLAWERTPGAVIPAPDIDWLEGQGTADNPYRIDDAEQMILLSKASILWDRHFVLWADIDLDPGLPGRSVFRQAVIPTFTGVFDGNGRTISHLTIKGESYLGLFGQLRSGGEVKNLRMMDVNVTGLGDYVGGLVGLSYSGTVSDCYSTGSVRGSSDVGGLVGGNEGASITASYSSGTVGGDDLVGGLVGENVRGGSIATSYSSAAVSGTEAVGGLVGSNGGSIATSYVTGSVSGTRQYTGGLVGRNYGDVTDCYSTGMVSGVECVGGLVGENSGWQVSHCYSTGAVSGKDDVGGLVGRNWGSIAASYSTGAVSGTGEAVGGLVGYAEGPWATTEACFWDIETSGQTTSVGGTGKATAEMQIASTFLDNGWDFIGETANGTADTWWILDGRDYPRLACEFWAFSPDPWNGQADVVQFVIVSWRAAREALAHDVYFGEDETAVAVATPASLGVYQGRQLAELNTYDPGALEWGTTYYWRIDEVNEANPNSPWKGSVWSFTTADYVVVDDFESYNDRDNFIFDTWLDGFGYGDPNIPAGGATVPPYYAGNGTGSIVGYMFAPFAEQEIVHGGGQSMPMGYDNDGTLFDGTSSEETGKLFYSEAERAWETPQDWTSNDADTLTLYFGGEMGNSPEPLYVGIEDNSGRIAVVVHPDAEAVQATAWQKWQIALADVQTVGVDVAAVKKMVIGVGDRNNPQPGGTGRIYIDDIRLTKRMP